MKKDILSAPEMSYQSCVYAEEQHRDISIQGEFKKLHDQVRQVSSGAALHPRGSSYSKKHLGPRNGEHMSKVYRSQLASSLKAFENKQWPCYDSESTGPDPSMPPRSRPTSSISDSRLARSRPGSSRPSTGVLSNISRPQSSPPYNAAPIPQPPSSLWESIAPISRPQSSHLVTPIRGLHSQHGIIEGSSSEILKVQNFPASSKRGTFDALTPAVVYELSDGLQPESVYGDRPESVLERLAEVDQETNASEFDSRVSTAFGFTSETDQQIDQSSSNDINKSFVHTSGDKDNGNKDTDIESDEEDYPEPQVTKINMDDLPHLALRPEKVDSLDIQIYAKGDRRKYDFDASVYSAPEYEFADPFPGELGELNFTQLSASEKDWRELTTARPEVPEEECIIDRLIEFGRHQQKTIEQEDARLEKLKAIRARQQKSKLYPMTRVQSAKTWRERACCLDCVQSACVGDCPGKPTDSGLCTICGERQCNGNCVLSAYESHSRGEAEEDKTKTKPKLRPRSCTCCQTQHTAKLINANNIILGRPPSGNATFTRGQGSYKPKDIRPKSQTIISPELQKEFERLGLEPLSPIKDSKFDTPPFRPDTAKGSRPHIGRAGVLPGKSYFSQRRTSLTERDVQLVRAKVEGNRNIRSSKRRRPKTAVP